MDFLLLSTKILQKRYYIFPDDLQKTEVLKMQIFTLEHVSPVYLLVLSIKLRSTRTYVAGQFTNVTVKAFIIDCTMLHKLSKCEVMASNIILPPLRIYVKSNFGEFKWCKKVIFGNFRDSEL